MHTHTHAHVRYRSPSALASLTLRCAPTFSHSPQHISPRPPLVATWEGHGWGHVHILLQNVLAVRGKCVSLQRFPSHGGHESMTETIKIEMNKVGTRLEADKEQFALGLKTWRLRNHLTQAEAGERIGVSRYTIIRAEQAKQVSWECLYRIFAYLSIELQREGL